MNPPALITVTERRNGTLLLHVAPWPVNTFTRSVTVKRTDLPRAEHGDRAAGTLRLFNQLVNHVARVYNLTPSDLTGPSRRKPLPEARAAVAWAMRQCPGGIGYDTIGRCFGRTATLTIMNMVAKAAFLRQTEASFRSLTESLLQHLNS